MVWRRGDGGARTGSHPAWRGSGRAATSSPLALYETSFELPAGWRNAPGAYVLLSESYRPDAEQASSLGWPAAELRVGHLGIVHDADVIAHSLIDLGG